MPFRLKFVIGLFPETEMNQRNPVRGAVMQNCTDAFAVCHVITPFRMNKKNKGQGFHDPMSDDLSGNIVAYIFSSCNSDFHRTAISAVPSRADRSATPFGPERYSAVGENAAVSRGGRGA